MRPEPNTRQNTDHIHQGEFTPDIFRDGKLEEDIKCCFCGRVALMKRLTQETRTADYNKLGESYPMYMEHFIKNTAEYLCSCQVATTQEYMTGSEACEKLP